MMADVILDAPEKHERGDKQDSSPVRSKYAAHLAQAGNIIIEMLDDIKPGHQIERSIFKGETLCRALLHFGQATRAAKVEGFSGYVDSFGSAELRQHLNICAGPTTNIENPRSRFSDVPANFSDKLRNDAAPASKPPVFPLDLVHDRVGVLLHLARERAVDVVSGGCHECWSVLKAFYIGTLHCKTIHTLRRTCG